MVKRMDLVASLVCLMVCLARGQGTPQPPNPGLLQDPGQQERSGAQATHLPLTQDQVQDLIQENTKDPDVVYKALDERGVDFDLNPKIERKMRAAGADDTLLQAIWKAGPTRRNTKSATLTSSSGAPLHANYEEAMGYETLENELDPDRRLRMVAEFERRFPASELMSSVYAQAAKANEQKGDLNMVVEYGEKSLKLDSNNLFSLLMVAMVLPQPRMLEGSPQQAAQQLATAEAYAGRALSLIAALPAQAKEGSEQLQRRKDALASDAHTALATVYMERDETEKAIDQFKTAISLAPRPKPELYFRLGEVCARAGKKAEAIEAFKRASEMGRGTPLGEYAEQKLTELGKQ